MTAGLTLGTRALRDTLRRFAQPPMMSGRLSDAGLLPAVNSEVASALPISVIVLTKNEELAIRQCLDSLRPFAEVFVVDSGSTDATVRLASAQGARVVQFEWNGQYPKKKQWALKSLPFSTQWVLYVDADEIVTDELVAELGALDLDRAAHSAFSLDLDYVFMGRRLRHGHKVEKKALLRIGANEFPQVDDLGATNMWEVEGHYQPLTNGSVGRLTSTLIHHDREPLFHYFERHNRYSDWEAHLRTSPGEKRSVAEARSRQGKLFDRAPGKPVLFFAYSYLLRAGFRDGLPGFNYALAQAFYYWQVYVKVKDLRHAAEPR
jgi:glycosyltransferase involved in cell wall biosynthesis